MRPGMRRGLTLIELLVVTAIIVALLGLVASIAPRLGDRQRASRGASQVQAWLNLSRQRAIRDKRPSGLRLIPPVGPFYAQYVSELQFIETPPDFTGGVVELPYDNTFTTDRYRYIRIRNVEMPITGNAAVQPGDVIDLSAFFSDDPKATALRRIVQIAIDPAGPNQYWLKLDAEVGGSLPLNETASAGGVTRLPTYRNFATGQSNYPAGRPPPYSENYKIYRQARPLPGEPLLQMPKGIAIDISQDDATTDPNWPRWYRLFPKNSNIGGGAPYDILFDPSGRVVGGTFFQQIPGSKPNPPLPPSTMEGRVVPGPTVGASRICLWVRDVAQNLTSPTVGNDFRATDPTVMPPGDNTLIAIHTRSGLIAAHAVDPTQLTPNTSSNPKRWNPFAFTQDGQSSGN